MSVNPAVKCDVFDKILLYLPCHIENGTTTLLMSAESVVLLTVAICDVRECSSRALGMLSGLIFTQHVSWIRHDTCQR